MRIAQVAPLAEPVPPKLYGGTERVVSWLTEQLLALGHEVTLFASGDSTTRARLIPVIPRAMRLRRPRPDASAAATLLLDAVAKAAEDFDVIHFHIDWIHLPLMEQLSAPFLTTCHGRLDLPGLSEIIQKFPSAPFISISESQRAPLAEAHWLGTVYHGMPPDLYRPSFEQGKYLAFLGRLTPDKGPVDAVEIAREAGFPLRIAAKMPRQQGRYFKEQIEPLIDGQLVQFTGEMDERGKGQLLRNALALLFPIDWPEPFGLVMIEAMACGTPVIAYRCGSVPEVIDHGITGFVVENQTEAIRAIPDIDLLDRRRIREVFEQRFTCNRMARSYLDHYQALVRGTASRPDAAIPAGDASLQEGIATTDQKGRGLLPRIT
jgi:glycosyltransferase involved in cell wall biosynthesis